jgi:hypothetical protein
MKYKGAVLGIITLIIALAVVYPAAYYSQWDTQDVTVTGKERITKVRDGSDKSYYLVYTNEGTFKVEDIIILFRFSSSDLYGSIKTDSTYTFNTVGFRAGFFSEYPNVVSID